MWSQYRVFEGCESLALGRDELRGGCRRGRRHGGVDDRTDVGNARRGKTGPPRVLANELLVRGEVDAVDLVSRHVDLDPLDVGAELLEGGTRPHRPSMQLVSRERPDSENRTLDHVFLHRNLRLEVEFVSRRYRRRSAATS